MRHSTCLVVALAAGCRQTPVALVMDAAVMDVAVADAAVMDVAVVDAAVMGAAVAPACSWAEVSAGSVHTCGRKTDGTLWCWGFNFSGTQVTALGSETAEVSARGAHTCGRKTDGTLWCWGNNHSGQLGDGTRTDPAGGTVLTPVQVTALGSATVEVSAGGWGFQWFERAHTCGRKTDGTLWCWGNNFFGQLGDGTTTDQLTPVQVAALGSATLEVSAGGVHTCGRKTDGTLWCWGDNLSGQLGNGTTTDHLTPVQVTALGSATLELSAGTSHTCARKTDGTLWCWGWNVSGQLGDGTTAGKLSPVQVTAFGSAAVEVSAGYEHTCGRKTDGTLWCWGGNSNGQLGDGGNVGSRTPVQVTALGNATQVSAGDQHTCARKIDGTLWCWGDNSNGQLGDGTATDRLTPVQVCK